MGTKRDPPLQFVIENSDRESQSGTNLMSYSKDTVSRARGGPATNFAATLGTFGGSRKMSHKREMESNIYFA